VLNFLSFAFTVAFIQKINKYLFSGGPPLKAAPNFFALFSLMKSRVINDFLILNKKIPATKSREPTISDPGGDPEHADFAVG
jgi:hypothetical protein